MCSHNCDRCVARSSSIPRAASFLSRPTMCAAIIIMTVVLPGAAAYPEQLLFFFYLDLRCVQP